MQPPHAPATPSCPPPRPPRYDGPLRIDETVDLKDTMSWIYEQMFVHAPAAEPFRASMARLVEALRADGERELRPTTVFVVYRRHPELGYPQENAT